MNENAKLTFLTFVDVQERAVTQDPVCASLIHEKMTLNKTDFSAKRV